MKSGGPVGPPRLGTSGNVWGLGTSWTLGYHDWGFAPGIQWVVATEAQDSPQHKESNVSTDSDFKENTAKTCTWTTSSDEESVSENEKTYLPFRGRQKGVWINSKNFQSSENTIPTHPRQTHKDYGQ